jgi:cyclase
VSFEVALPQTVTLQFDLSYFEKTKIVSMFVVSGSASLLTTLATILIGSTASAAGIDYDNTEIITQQLAPNFFALTGSPGTDPGHPEAAGGRIGVLTGPDGVFLVDAGYKPLTGKVITAVRKLSSGPIRFLVNTHEHPDHTGGNPEFAKMGTLIIARDEVRQELVKPLPAAVGDAASATGPARLPGLTFGAGAPLKIYFDDETIDLIPLPAAHTNGDTMIRFEKADVIMIGDIYRNYGYPFVDPSHGGSFRAIIEALDVVMKAANPGTKLAPGHGTVITRADIAPYREMIVAVSSRVQQMTDEGRSEEEVLAAKLTAPYDAKVPGGVAPLPGAFGTSASRETAQFDGDDAPF